VGLIGVRLAKHFGAGRIIATTRAGRTNDLLVSLGVDHVVQPRAGSVSDHGKPQLEGLGDQLIHQGRDHGIHHPGHP
jgi:NADPH:quinone reductase-like Zn-dependent oxidoreductase